MRFEDHAYEAKENGHRYKSPNNVDSAHRLTIPPQPRRVGLLRLRRRSGACRQPLAITRAGVRVSPESFATISSPRWTTDRSSRRIDDRLPDKITVPVSAAQRCQTRTNYRCKSHP